MRVLFDYQCFQMQKFGGVSNSYVQLIMQLYKLGVDVCIGMKDTRNFHLIRVGLVSKQSNFKRIASGLMSRVGKSMDNIPWKVALDSSKYNRQFSVDLLEKQDFDVFEPTFFDPYFIPYLKGKPFVITIHDMIMERFPGMHIDDLQQERKKLICSKATMLHCPSENTKKDIMELYGLDPNMIEVIYHGAPERIQFETKPIVDVPYILYVGDRRLYKNFVPFVKECAKLFEIYPELHLVCTGAPFSNTECKLLTSLHIEKKVHHQRVSDKKMANLYYNAVAFVYPSLYEGFGLPILEAFTYNCPVLLTPYSCFPEIAGDAALYFEMKDSKSDFVDVFRQLYTMAEEDRSRLLAKGNERLKRFSWEQSAKKLVDIYERLRS
ncbi:MAG: glycosyltransferase family 4 protein [Bacteroidales bacterium]|nr:glycosyltransferase family 4 protein [Bacteroidales bacterium]